MSVTALSLTALLLLFPIIVSYKEKLHIAKDLLIAGACHYSTVNIRIYFRFYI